MRRAALLSAAVALAACIPPPKRVEQLGIAPAAPEVSLIVIPAENMRRTIEFNRKHNRGTNPFDPISALNKDQPLNTLVQALNYNFKSVVKVDSLNQAKQLDGDLIGLVDYSFDYTVKQHFALKKDNVYTGGIRIDEALVLLDRAGAQVAKIAVSASREAKEFFGNLSAWTPFTQFGVNQNVVMFNGVQDEALARFQKALSENAELKAWLARKPAAAVPVASAPGAASPSSDVDAPRFRKSEDASKFAVVVGVDEYENLPSAEFAEHDARAVRDHLLALGYPERNVILLTGREAGKSGLEKYLESWLPRNVDDKSQVFVYFAGHGAPDTKTGEAYLMPYDADAKFVETTAYPLKKLYAGLGALKARRVVVALDACFSGAGGRSVLAQGARPLVAKMESGIPGSPRLAVLEAASGDEVTGTLKPQSHGLFTYFLLKGLDERGGDASVKALHLFLKPKVQDAARRDGRDQTPALLGAAKDGDEAL